LEESKTVLFYKEENDQRRPYRSIQLKNETPHTLGKGICEVFLDNDFQGKCVLEACKPGEDAILVHAKETGVKVFKKLQPVEQRRVSIKLNKGRILFDESHRQRVEYSIENSKPEEFHLELEYKKLWQCSTIKASDNAVVTNTANGVRVGCKLASNAVLSVELVETYTRSYEFAASLQWIERNIIAIKNPLIKNMGIQKCVDFQKKITELAVQIEQNDEQIESIKEEQTRLKDLIPSAHAEQANSWKSELGENEKTLRDLSRVENPRLKKEMAALENELNETLRSLTASWEDEECKEQ
jgi:paraquat-inducible protein B